VRAIRKTPYVTNPGDGSRRGDDSALGGIDLDLMKDEKWRE